MKEVPASSVLARTAGHTCAAQRLALAQASRSHGDRAPSCAPAPEWIAPRRGPSACPVRNAGYPSVKRARLTRARAMTVANGVAAANCRPIGAKDPGALLHPSWRDETTPPRSTGPGRRGRCDPCSRHDGRYTKHAGPRRDDCPFLLRSGVRNCKIPRPVLAWPAAGILPPRFFVLRRAR
jgi:hypothetical protein